MNVTYFSETEHITKPFVTFTALRRIL